MIVHVGSSTASLDPIPVSSDGPVHIDVHVRTYPGTDITVEPLSVTANGTYTAPSGKAYSPVNVDVPGGGFSTMYVYCTIIHDTIEHRYIATITDADGNELTYTDLANALDSGVNVLIVHNNGVGYEVTAAPIRRAQSIIWGYFFSNIDTSLFYTNCVCAEGEDIACEVWCIIDNR